MSDTAVVKAEPQTVDAGQLIAQAIDKGLPIDTMERLLAMRRELKAEAAREAFFSALSNFQSECPEIQKTKTVMNKDGKTVRYKYAPLDTIIQAVKVPLKDNGFSYTIKTEQDNGSVTAICRLHHVEGHTEETQLTVPVDKGSYMSAPQQIAAALTYAKRYAFCDATGIMTADEDNDAAPDFDISKGTPGKCRGCGAEIYWVETKSGKNMPVNRDGTSHFATCPKADEFRGKEGDKSRNDQRKELIDKIAEEVKKHKFPERELAFYREEITKTPTEKLPELLEEIKKVGAIVDDDGVSAAFDGTIEDAEFEPQEEELPLETKTVIGKEPVKDIF
jgi:hypothetical protein